LTTTEIAQNLSNGETGNLDLIGYRIAACRLETHTALYIATSYEPHHSTEGVAQFSGWLQVSKVPKQGNARTCFAQHPEPIACSFFSPSLAKMLHNMQKHKHIKIKGACLGRL